MAACTCPAAHVVSPRCPLHGEAFERLWTATHRVPTAALRLPARRGGAPEVKAVVDAAKAAAAAWVSAERTGKFDWEEWDGLRAALDALAQAVKGV